RLPLAPAAVVVIVVKPGRGHKRHLCPKGLPPLAPRHGSRHEQQARQDGAADLGAEDVDRTASHRFIPPEGQRAYGASRRSASTPSTADLLWMRRGGDEAAGGGDACRAGATGRLRSPGGRRSPGW